MKSVLGVLGAFLLVTTLAVGQQSDLPFPQGANPALQNDTYAPAVADQRNLPTSMAFNQSSPTAYPGRHDNIATGSPFPMDADPSPNKNNGITPSFERSNEFDPGSPFPTAAAPALP